MGKFSPRLPTPKPIVVSTPSTLSTEEKVVEEDKAVGRLRVAKKRRKGRRSSILSDISREEAQSTSVERVAGRAAKILFGS